MIHQARARQVDPDLAEQLDDRPADPRRPVPGRAGLGPAARVRPGLGPGRGAGHRRRGAALPRDHQPAHRHRRRPRHGLPRGGRAPRHGVHAVPPDRPLHRRLGPAPADRGPPRRRGLPPRQQRPPVHARATTRSPSSPRATTSRWPSPAQMAKTQHPNVYLDLSHLDPDFIRQRFPGIDRLCQSFDLDITRDPIPVCPGAHYMIGGVTIDEPGRTTPAGPLGRRRGHQLGPARRQPAGLEQPARGAGLRRPRGRGHRRRARSRRAPGSSRSRRSAAPRPSNGQPGQDRPGRHPRIAPRPDVAADGHHPRRRRAGRGRRPGRPLVPLRPPPRLRRPGRLGHAEHADRRPADDRRRHRAQGVARRPLPLATSPTPTRAGNSHITLRSARRSGRSDSRVSPDEPASPERQRQLDHDSELGFRPSSDSRRIVPSTWTGGSSQRSLGMTRGT